MLKGVAKAVGVGVLRSVAIRRLALSVAAARRRGLILIYHRIADETPTDWEIVSSLPTSLFRHQLEMLGEIGKIVSLTDLLQSSGAERHVRFAITLDDDYMSHVRHSLPVLLALGVPATFFLSGRSLHGLGHYWWELLEAAIGEWGLQETRKFLNLPGRNPQELAVALEGSPVIERLEDLTIDHALPPHLGIGDIQAIARAGMEVGFHTLHHSRLDTLSEDAVDQALFEGRAELVQATGHPVQYLAYPHGRANSMVARCARAAGYKAACGGGGRPVNPKSDPLLLGRWEPGPLEGDDFLASIVLRLNR